jgi:hypothetical protein
MFPPLPESYSYTSRASVMHMRTELFFYYRRISGGEIPGQEKTNAPPIEDCPDLPKAGGASIMNPQGFYETRVDKKEKALTAKQSGLLY